MEIWLDTADLGIIETAKQMGILHGVTTNPTIIAKSKMGLQELLEKILSSQSGPVTAQVTAKDAGKMIEQGRALYLFSNRMIVKVPVTDEGLKAIHVLNKENIPTMATAVFDLAQVLLAARAGATYIAPYFSLMCELEASGIDQFGAMLNLIKRYQYPSKLIAASLHSSEQARQCLELGADALTLSSDVFSSLTCNHEQTIHQMEKFARDWQGAPASKQCRLGF